MKVATVIPGLNWRIWKTLDEQQVTALAHAAEVAALAHEVYKDAPSREISRDAFSIISQRNVTPVNSDISPKGPPSVIREATGSVSFDGLAALQNGGNEGDTLFPKVLREPRSPKVLLREPSSPVSVHQSQVQQNGRGAGHAMPDDPVFCIPSAPWTENANSKPHVVVYVANEKEAAFVPDSVKYTPSVGLRHHL